MKIGDTVQAKKGTGLVTAIKAGWATVDLGDGKTDKVRVPSEKPKKAATKAPAKKAAATKAPAKKAAAKKAPAKKAVAKKKPAAKKAAEGDDDKLVKADLDKYTVHDTKTASGRRHLDIGDGVADKLRELSLEDIYRYASKLTEMPATQLHKQYGHLNPGMQRMNLGNRIRGVYRLAEKTKGGFSKIKEAQAAAGV